MTGAKADERQTLLGILTADPALVTGRAGQTLIGDKNYFGAEFEAILAAGGQDLLRPPARASPTAPARDSPVTRYTRSVNPRSMTVCFG